MQYETLESGSAIPLLRTLDIRLTEIGQRHAVMEVALGDKHLNYAGGAHGGLVATLIDTVCFFPRPFLPSGRRVTTTNLNVNYLRAAAKGDHLRARSQILHHGRRSACLRVEVVDGQEHLIAHGTVTLMILKEPEEA